MRHLRAIVRWCMAVGMLGFVLVGGVEGVYALSAETGHCIIANYSDDASSITAFGGCYDFKHVGSADEYATFCSNFGAGFSVVTAEGSSTNNNECSGTPDSSILSSLTQWNSTQFCAYEEVGSPGEIVGCITDVPKTQNCLDIFGYVGTSFPGEDNAGICPGDNDSDFSTAKQTAQEKADTFSKWFTPVSDSVQCCIQHTGDFSAQNVESCAAPEQQNGQMACANPDPGEKLKTSTQACGAVQECKVLTSCCVIFQDTNKDGKYQTGEEVNQCHPSVAGCGTIFYQSEQATVDITTAEVYGSACGAVPACGGAGVTLSTQQALDKKLTNVAKSNTPVASSSGKSTDSKGWTKDACLAKKGHQWSPPENKSDATSGPYCFVIPPVALNIDIGGVEKATIVEYVPLVFNYGFILLGVASVVTLGFSGAQMAAAAGNATAVAGAKSMIIASAVAAGTAAGGYGVLQTISPQTIAFEAPPIQAVLKQEVDLGGDVGSFGAGQERLCCKDGYCSKIKIHSEASPEWIQKIEATCGPYTVGSLCRQSGLLADQCAALGGDCMVRKDVDPKTAGQCSEWLQAWGVTSSKAAAELALVFVNAPLFYTDSTVQFLSGGEVSLNPAVMASKISADWKAGLPGEGLVGTCIKRPTNRKSGDPCLANSECASGKCVRNEWTAGCFVAQETGYCSSGLEGSDCHPLNHTLLDGVNVFTNAVDICVNGNECVLTHSGDYSCSSGNLGSSCGDYKPEEICDAVFPQLVKKFDQNETLLANQADALGVTQEVQEVGLKDMVAMAGGTVSGVAYAAALDVADILLKSTTVLYSIIEAANVAEQATAIQMKFTIARQENLAHQIKNTPPDLMDCEIEPNGTKEDFCKNGTTCKEVSSLNTVGGNLFMCVEAGGVVEGSACDISGQGPNMCAITGLGGNDAYDCYPAPSGTTQAENGGGFCSKQASKKADVAFNSWCTFNSSEEIQASGGSSLAFVGCEGVKPDGNVFSADLPKNSNGEFFGSSVCYKATASNAFGRCGWYSPDVEGEKVLQYPTSSSGTVYLENDGAAGTSVGLTLKPLGELCTRVGGMELSLGANGKPQIPASLSPQCAGGLTSSNVVSAVNGLLQEKYGDANYGTIPLWEYARDRTYALPVCRTKDLSTIAGKCTLQIVFPDYEATEGCVANPEVCTSFSSVPFTK